MRMCFVPHSWAASKIERHVRDGDLTVVACKTQANRFVQYKCKWCGDYVVAKHSTWASSQEVALARCNVLWFFQYQNEEVPVPAQRTV